MIDVDLLCRVADKLEKKRGWGLCNSKWQKRESEVIADQTIRACANNYRSYNEALSWATWNAISGQGPLINSPAGLAILGGDIVLEPYTGNLVPSKPNATAKDDAGRYLVFRVTPLLLKYADWFTDAHK